MSDAASVSVDDPFNIGDASRCGSLTDAESFVQSFKDEVRASGGVMKYLLKNVVTVEDHAEFEKDLYELIPEEPNVEYTNTLPIEGVATLERRLRAMKARQHGKILREDQTREWRQQRALQRQAFEKANPGVPLPLDLQPREAKPTPRGTMPLKYGGPVSSKAHGPMPPKTPPPTHLLDAAISYTLHMQQLQEEGVPPKKRPCVPPTWP